MSYHSVIEHRANYHFLKVEEDYLAICSYGVQSPHCKALILATLEHWMNVKRDTDQGDFIYLTIPEWIEQTYEFYARNVISDSLKELLDEQLIERRSIKRFDQDTFEYRLNIEEVQKRIRALPEKSPKDPKPNLTAYRQLQELRKEQHRAERKARAEKAKEEGSLKINDGVGEKSTAVNNHVPVGEKSPTPSSEGSLKINDGYVKSQRNIDTLLTSSLASLSDTGLSSSSSTQNDPSSEDEENKNTVGVGSNDEPPTQCHPDRAGNDPDNNVAGHLAPPRVPVQDTRGATDKQPTRAAQQTGAKPAGGSARRAPKTELTEHQKQRARALKMRIEDRCGVLNTSGPNIGEDQAIAKLILKYSDADIDDTVHYLSHCHWKWSQQENKYKIRGNIILEEIEPTLKLFAEDPSYRDRTEPPARKTPPKPASDGPRRPKLPPVPPEWRAKHAAMMAGGR